MVSNAINIYLLVSELQYHKSYMFTNNFFYAFESQTTMHNVCIYLQKTANWFIYNFLKIQHIFIR